MSAKKFRYYRLQPFSWTEHSVQSVRFQLRRMHCRHKQHKLELIEGRFWCNHCALIWDSSHA